MTKRTALFLTLLLFPIVFSAAAPAQNRSVNYGPLRAIDLHPTARRAFKRYFGGDGITSPMTEGFYPIGWSRDGKFAYYVEPVDEACGCYFAELRIQDLRTDKILWQFKNNPESRINADGSPVEDDLQRLWKRNQKLFNAKLNEHRIIESARFMLLGRSFTSAGRTYSIQMRVVKEYDEGFGVDRARSINVELISPALGKKKVYGEDQKDELFLSPLEAAVAGAFKSPYEDRVAIVMITMHRGWEGPPHTVNVQIVGADLKNGFKK